jgi:hypothetical protein
MQANMAINMTTRAAAIAFLVIVETEEMLIGLSVGEGVSDGLGELENDRDWLCRLGVAVTEMGLSVRVAVAVSVIVLEKLVDGGADVGVRVRVDVGVEKLDGVRREIVELAVVDIVAVVDKVIVWLCASAVQASRQKTSSARSTTRCLKGAAVRIVGRARRRDKEEGEEEEFLREVLPLAVGSWQCACVGQGQGFAKKR